MMQNVAPEDDDLSHPAYYRRQVRRGKGSKPLEQCNRGQPGCTDAERERFRRILADGDMVDAYRHVNSDGVGPEYAFSWRGAMTGIESGRGMRIDHCITTRSLLKMISDVSITGHGADRNGFLGSDHSPLLIRLDAANAEKLASNTSGK